MIEPAADLSLDGLVALVTGGAGFLGATIGATLGARGAKVVVADIDETRAKSVAAELAHDGHVALAIELDVTSEASVASAFAAAVEHFGRLDVLVNNAAPTTFVRRDAPVAEVDLAVWRGVLDGIVGGALLCSRQAIPLIAEQGGGSIVNIASVHAHAADPQLTAYSVGKAALLGLTRATATQYGSLGIRCNSVSLGTIAHPHLDAHWTQAKIRHQAVAHLGRPTDAAHVVAFLAAPASAFITGTDIVADGGLLSHLPAFADADTRLPRASKGD